MDKTIDRWTDPDGNGYAFKDTVARAQNRATIDKMNTETADRKSELDIERKRIDNLIQELPATAGEYQQSKLVLHSYDNTAVKCTTTSGNYTNVPAFTTDQGGPLSYLYTKKSNYQIAVNKSGLYLFELRIHVNSLIANKRVELAPFVNDTRIAALASSYNTAGSFTLTQIAALPLWLSANDTVDFKIAPIDAAEVSLQLGDVLVYAIDWEDKFKIPDYTGYAAETKDIRTGADGTVYGTAGEAVRKQIGNLTEDLADVENHVFIGGEYQNADVEWVDGRRFPQNTNDIGKSVNPSTSLGYYASFIKEIDSKKKYKVSYYKKSDNMYHVIYLDRNDLIISGDGLFTDGVYHGVIEQELIIPSNTVKIIVNSSKDFAQKGLKELIYDDLATEKYVDSYAKALPQNVDNTITSNGGINNGDVLVESISSALNGVDFCESLTPRIPVGTGFSHGGEMVIKDGIKYAIASANNVDTGDSPDSVNCFCLLAKIGGENISQTTTTYYDVAKYNDVDSDGETIISGVGSGVIRLVNETIHITCTAKTNSGYHLYHRTFNPSTNTFSALKKCKLDGNAFSSVNVSSKIGENIDVFICVNGFIGNNNGTYYGGVALDHRIPSGIIVSTTDFENYATFSVLDIEDSVLNYEMSVAFFNNQLWCALRQYQKYEQILVKVNMSGNVVDKTTIADGGSKSSFFIHNNKLYLIHNIIDRNRDEILQMNESIFSEPISLMVANCYSVYPFVYVDGSDTYLVSTRNSSTRVYVSKMIMPTYTSNDGYKIIKALKKLL